jgi:hypothetical protein
LICLLRICPVNDEPACGVGNQTLKPGS